MSSNNPEADEEIYAKAFGREDQIDPLAQHEATFNRPEVPCPLDKFLEIHINESDRSDATKGAYERHIRHWKEYMEQKTERHPACPNEHHVEQWANWLRHGGSGEKNTNRTLKFKYQHVGAAFKWMGRQGYLPHSGDPETNVFLKTRSELDLTRDPVPDPPRLTVEQLTEYVRKVKRTRDRLIMVLQPKLGLRAGEVCNIKISEMNIEHPDLQEHYPTMGTHEAVEERPNSIVIPSRYERKGNKSYRTRVLPLDDETRSVILRYLLIRPENDEDWLVLTDNTHGQCQPATINFVWTKAFEDFEVPSNRRKITSHYGRHFFSTYWEIHEDIPTAFVHYMRGDEITIDSDENVSLNYYLHTYYEDIEEIYRKRTFRFGL